MTPSYRADIDGLRAIAVLSVLFFHSGTSFFTGGYVGVDIFFVISGYLITTIIVREIATNDFSITRFYERRFRRILPALVVVIAVSLLTGCLLLTPSNLVDLGESAVATALFSSNIFFYFGSGYFDGPAETKPLLHTWSLAVEEQYYIFFPLLLVIIAKVDTKHYLKWLSILGFMSFLACAVITYIDPKAAFYLIPTRAWELFMGSVIALHVLPSPKSRLTCEMTSLLGIILIIYSVFGFTSDTTFPGIAAAVPTIGTALIIYSGSDYKSLVSKALSSRPFVFVGLISYSLYLWHWPVIVYTNLFSINEPSSITKMVMFTVIFILSILSWRHVETPFRKKKLLNRKTSLLGASAIASLFILSCGFVFIAMNGFPQRYENIVTAKHISIDPEWKHWGSCERLANNVNTDQDLCNVGAYDGVISFIFWGDSHAKALASGVDISAKNQNVKGIVATRPACPPLITIERRGRVSCHNFNQAVLKKIANSPEIETVILAARWALSTKGTRYKNEPGDPIELVEIASRNDTSLTNVTLFSIGLRRTIAKLHNLGKKVVLVGPVPEIGINVPSAYFVAKITGRNTKAIISPTTEEYFQRTEEVNLEFTKLKANYNIQIIDLASYLCNKKYCEIIDQGELLYRDSNHLSTFGSKYVSQAFDIVF